MKKVLTLLSASALGFTGIFTLGATTSSSYATEAEQPKQEKQYTFKFATDDVVQAMAPFLKTAENDIYANAYDYAAHIIRTPHVFNYVTNKIFEHGLFAQGTSDKVLNDLKQESNFDKITADFNALGVGMTDQQRKRFILNYIITLRAQWKVEVAREAYYRAYVNQNNGKAPRPSDVIGLIGDDFNITNLQALSKIGNQQLRESLLQEYQAISQAQKISNHETDLDFIRGAKNIDGQGFALDMQTSPYRNNDGTLYPGKGQITRQDSADSGVLVADFSDFVDDEEDENNDAPSSQGQSTQKENVVKNDSDLFDDESSVSVTDSEEDESKKSDESISSDEDGNDDFNFFEESASEDETQGVINPKNKLQPNEFNSKGEWDPFGIDNEPSAQNQAPAASSPSAAATAIPADQADWGAELFGYGDGSEPANAPATEKTLPTNSADEFSKQEFNDLLSRAGVSYNDLLIWHKEILRSTVRRGSNQGTWNSVTSRHGLDKMRENFSAQNIIARATFEALNNEGQYSQSLQEAINNLTSPNDQQFLNAYGQALWQKAQEKRGLNKGPQEKSAASERGGDAFDGIDLGEGQDWGDIEDFDSLAQEESARKEQERYDSLAEARERDTEAESTAKEEDEVEAAPQRPARKALEAETFTNIDQLDRYQILRNTFPEVDDTKLESIARRENSVFSGYIMTELSNGQENLRFDDPRFANSVEAFAKELGLSPEELRAKESDLDAAIKAQAEEEHNVARREAAKKEQSSDPFADLFDESGKPQGGSVPQPPSVTEKQVKEANQTLWDGAIAGNYYDVARALQLEASVNALDPVSFETALILASQADENEEQLRVVDRLLEAGADVNIANRNGENALHAAAQAGNAGTVRKLLAAGANPLAVTNEGQTPLDIAKEENHEEIVALLEALQSGDIASRQPILPAQQDKPQRPAMSQMKDEDELEAAAATTVADGADDEDDFFGEIDLGEGQNWGDIDDFAPASVDPDVASEGVSPDVIGGGSDGDEEPPVARNLTPEFNDAADDGQGEREEPYSIPPGEPGGSAGAPVGGSAVADDEDEGDDNSSDGSSSDGEGDDRSEADFIPDESPFQREFNELVRLQSAIAKWDANDKGADYYNLMKELHAKAVEVRHLYADEVLYPIAIKLEQLERNKTIEKEKVREALNFIRTK